MNSNDFRIGIGGTEELSLRVSVATLVRVLFKHPMNDEWMLALERKATLRDAESGSLIQLMCQPFGGAVRIKDLGDLQNQIGNFHFDSDRSKAEQDFRIFIRPSDWPAVRDFCIEQFSHADNLIFETDPTRELVEEFNDALKVDLQAEQYVLQLIETVVEDTAAPTANIHASGRHTVRVYRIFEALILDESLLRMILSNSEEVSDQTLGELAREDARMAGKGRANAALALSLRQLTDAYLARSPEERNKPFSFANHQLEETVGAVLDNLDVPKYRRL